MLQALAAWPWLRILKIAAILAIGFAAAWWIQDIQIGKYQNDIIAYKGQLKTCQDANAGNTAVIDRLKADIQNAAGICEGRLETKDGLLKRLREIDAIKTRETGHEKGNSLQSGADPLLDELNRLFPG